MYSFKQTCQCDVPVWDLTMHLCLQDDTVTWSYSKLLLLSYTNFLRFRWLKECIIVWFKRRTMMNIESYGRMALKPFGFKEIYWFLLSTGYHINMYTFWVWYIDTQPYDTIVIPLQAATHCRTNNSDKTRHSRNRNAVIV